MVLGVMNSHSGILLYVPKLRHISSYVFYICSIRQYLNEKDETMEDLKDPEFHNLSHFTMVIDSPKEENGGIPLKTELQENNVHANNHKPSDEVVIDNEESRKMLTDEEKKS